MEKKKAAPEEDAETEICRSCDGTGVDLWHGIADRDCTMCSGRGRVPKIAASSAETSPRAS